MDKLAASGATFARAYAQYALCSPSRTSIMTGQRPDTTRIYDLDTHFRVHQPDVVTLPQHFAAHGYATQAIGKVYHLPLDDPRSWNISSWAPQKDIEYRDPTLRAQLIAANPEGSEDIVLERDAASGTILRVEGRTRTRGPAWEAPEVDDSALPDGEIAQRAVDALGALRNGPFFLAVGFKKPHLPFVAPRRYFDLYPPEKVPGVANAFPPLGLPDYERHRAELPRYAGVPGDLSFSESQRRDLLRGYAAAVSYADAQIGRVLDELDRLRLTDETIVVLWGDHGYFLGENGLWAKHNTLELATRAPLLIRAPGMTRAGMRIDALVELVDLYPTLLELANLPARPGLEGTSLAPLLRSPDSAWKDAAFSQYRRNGATGRSMRTARYRYTEWRQHDDDALKARVLFDHALDPGENVNLADLPEHEPLVRRLSERLAAGWRAAMPESSSIARG
jgi:arylsulfatase A-like enzyme